MERNLALEVVRVTEAAALSAALWMGRGKEKEADQAAVESMRKALNSVSIAGTVVIGEGERDEAPMLFIGEKVGCAPEPKVDIALDPLEGTTIVAQGRNNALSVIAVANKGCLLHAPDTYMDKIAVGPQAKGAIDLADTPTKNLKNIAKKLHCSVSDLTVIILDRPRHAELIKEVRKAGARIKLIQDGDVSAAIATAVENSGIDVLMGIGGAPEGVLAAAALQCLGGDFQGCLKPRNHQEVERAQKMGVTDINKVFQIHELARGEDIMFSATGVTDGDLLKGVRFFRGGAFTHSVVMRFKSGTIRFINATHYFEKKPVY